MYNTADSLESLSTVAARSHLGSELSGHGGAQQLLVLGSAGHQDLLNRHHMVATVSCTGSIRLSAQHRHQLTGTASRPKVKARSHHNAAFQASGWAYELVVGVWMVHFI